MKPTGVRVPPRGLSAARRWSAAAFACAVLLLSGCGGPAPAAPDSPPASFSSDPSAAAVEAARKQQAEAVFRSFLDLDWQIITHGGLGPADTPPQALTDVMTGEALAESLDYYRWIHIQRVEVTGSRPSVDTVSVESSERTVSLDVCLDWTSVVMVTDRVPEWRGQVRGVRVSLERGDAAYRIVEFREGYVSCNL